MLSLSTERIWTIMFTIPLPLMLSSGAMAHEPAVETKAIVTTEMAVEPIKLEWSQRDGLPDIAFDYPGAACGDKKSLSDAGPALRNDVVADEALVLAGSQGLSRDFVTLEETSPTGVFCAGAPARSRRCDDFVSFQAQAPPRLPVIIYTPLAHRAVLPAHALPTHRHFAAVANLDSLPVLESGQRLAALSIPFPSKNSWQRKRFRPRSESSELART